MSRFQIERKPKEGGAVQVQPFILKRAILYFARANDTKMQKHLYLYMTHAWTETLRILYWCNVESCPNIMVFIKAFLNIYIRFTSQSCYHSIVPSTSKISIGVPLSISPCTPRKPLALSISLALPEW